MKLLDQFAMPKRCGDCAFTEGTDAHAKSGVLAQLCVEAREPFCCHRRNDAGELIAREHDGDAILCRGYVDALAASDAKPEWYRAVSKELITIWDDAAAGRQIDDEEIRRRVIDAGNAVEDDGAHPRGYGHGV